MHMHIHIRIHIRMHTYTNIRIHIQRHDKTPKHKFGVFSILRGTETATASFEATLGNSYPRTTVTEFLI